MRRLTATSIKFDDVRAGASKDQELGMFAVIDACVFDVRDPLQSSLSRGVSESA